MFSSRLLSLYSKVSILAFFLSSTISAHDIKISIEEKYLNDALNLVNRGITEHDTAKKLQYFLAIAMCSINQGFTDSLSALNKINFDIPTQPNCLSSNQVKNLLKIADNIFEEPKKIFIDKINIENKEHLSNVIINAITNNLPALVKINNDNKKDWYIVTRFDNKRVEIIGTNLQVIRTSKDDFFNNIVMKNIILFKYTLFANMHGYNKPCNLL